MTSTVLRIPWLAGLLAGLFFLGGCSLRQAAPAKSTYLMEAHRTAPAPAASGFGALRVRSIQVAAPFEGRGFVYRRGELHYESDFYHEFLVPPRTVVTDQVRQWFSDSGLFARVLEPSSQADAALSLEGTVSALYGDFREHPKAVLAIHFVVMDEHAGSATIRFQHAYRQEIAVDSGGAETLAGGWSKALAGILTEFEKDLSASAVAGR